MAYQIICLICEVQLISCIYNNSYAKHICHINSQKLLRQSHLRSFPYFNIRLTQINTLPKHHPLNYFADFIFAILFQE